MIKILMRGTKTLVYLPGVYNVVYELRNSSQKLDCMMITDEYHTDADFRAVLKSNTPDYDKIVSIKGDNEPVSFKQFKKIIKKEELEELKEEPKPNRIFR